MSDPIPPEQPEPADSFRKIAVDAVKCGHGRAGFTGVTERLDALLAAEDEHPPTPTAWVAMTDEDVPSIHGGFAWRPTLVESGGAILTECEIWFDDEADCNWFIDEKMITGATAPVDEHPPTFHVIDHATGEEI